MEQQLENAVKRFKTQEEINAFISGVDWQKERVWHTSDEKPDGKRLVLAIGKTHGEVALFVDIASGNKWCYLEDILKED